MPLLSFLEIRIMVIGITVIGITLIRIKLNIFITDSEEEVMVSRLICYLSGFTSTNTHISQTCIERRSILHL